MNPTVLSALIGAVSAIIVQLIGAWQQKKKRAIEEAIKEERLENRLKSIEQKLYTHNGYAEKLGSIQADIADVKTNIAVMQNDIKNLYKMGE